MSEQEINPYFLRLPGVLKILPISRSTWLLGIQQGRFPKPIKLSERCSAWRRADIIELCDRLAEKK